jgi:hypothetical protein
MSIVAYTWEYGVVIDRLFIYNSPFINIRRNYIDQELLFVEKYISNNHFELKIEEHDNFIDWNLWKNK